MATIEIDGTTFDVENGKMIIEVADEAGIYIPRFCYHKKLSVAANCRMCLVQVENNKKPVPACATPITNGMKVFTKSPEAIHSQKAVMEFLLINHPLDCPVCDQGGECELQDLSMGFGYSESDYDEKKRAVDDENLGALISTEMTRCIHCTRCVRFGDEVAGLRELGSLGRGEKTEIGTYINNSMTSEVSGNVIDLCPVGALTSKPFRFQARPWEMTQHPSLAPHDCLGSNLYLHTRRSELMRAVPRENETINETWLSDRDRFSYLGLKSQARIAQPRIKVNSQWQTVDWETALQFAADGINRIIQQHGPSQFAAFASPSSTTEEFYLLQKLMRALGVNNLDYRLQQTDFRDDAHLPTQLTGSLPYCEIENQNAVLLLGCNIEREVPLAGIRVRKAWRNGAKICAINPVDYNYHFKLHAKSITNPLEIPLQVANLLLAMVKNTDLLPLEIQRLLIGLEANQAITSIADTLDDNAVIITGAIAENHPEAALLRTLLHALETFTSVKVIRLTVGANVAGARLAGMLPHSTTGGKAVEFPGLPAARAIESRLKGYLLQAVDPGFDFADPYNARQALLAAEFVVVLSAFAEDSISDFANVILPVAPYAETSGTYINLDYSWQTVQGVCPPFGESRPAWKILRVLGNLLDCKDFDFFSSNDVLEAFKTELSMAQDKPRQLFYVETLPLLTQKLVRIGEWPLYRTDCIVRQAEALQNCAAAEKACLRIHPQTARRLNLEKNATVSQGNIAITLPVEMDERIAPDAVWVLNALPETVDLGHSFAEITVTRDSQNAS